MGARRAAAGRRPRRVSADSSRERAVLEPLRGPGLDRPGAQLMNMLIGAGLAKGLSTEELAHQSLGVSAHFFNSLRNGGRSVPALRPDRIARSARFLRMPLVGAQLAAGQLRFSDFFADPDELAESLASAIHYIRGDPEFGPLMPPVIQPLSAEMQHLIVTLYERATGRTLLPLRASAATATACAGLEADPLPFCRPKAARRRDM